MSKPQRLYTEEFRFSKFIGQFTEKEAQIYYAYRAEIRFIEHALKISKGHLQQPFLDSIYEQIKKRGKLSPKQVIAIHNFKKRWIKMGVYRDCGSVAKLGRQEKEIDECFGQLELAEMNLYDKEFFESLFTSWHTYRRLSDKQLYHVFKLREKYHKSIMVNLFT